MSSILTSSTMDTPREKPRPHRTPETEAERAAREARVAAALRENLRRRKEQARARRAEEPPCR